MSARSRVVIVAPALVALAACGRLRFDAVDRDAPASLGDAVRADAFRFEAGVCPAGYSAIGGSCYRMNMNEFIPWLDAELSCEADGVGAHLATIDDLAEAQVVGSFAQFLDGWFGMTDRVVEGTYVDVTGSAPGYLVWDAGEPIAEDCGQINLSLQRLTTKNCLVTDQYICEYDGRPAQPSAY